MSIDQKRSHERSKYLTLAQRSPSYGASNHGREALDLVASWEPVFTLDCGCGRNNFVDSLRVRGFRGAGLDFAFPEADIRAPMHAIPLPAGCVDVVTAFDSLEHLLPQEVGAVFEEMRRVAVPGGRFVFSISTRPSRIKVGGEGLHPTVQPKAWWAERIAEVGLIESDDRYLVGRFHESKGDA